MKPENGRIERHPHPVPLPEAVQTLEAIRNGEVDAVVVEGALGPRVYTLEGPDRPFQEFVEHMRQGAVTLDLDDIILYCNGFFAELLRAPLEQVIGATLASFVSTKDQELYRLLRERSRHSPVSGEVRLLTSDARETAVHFSFNPLTGTDPLVCCLVVTDLREQEKARKEQVAREAAESANQAKDQFLALLSHELRAPLHSILGWAQVLGRMESIDPDARRGIEAIERNARSQAHLVSDLLDLSRITSGKLHLRNRRVDFLEVLDSVTASIAPSLEDRSLVLECSLARGEATVEGDPDRLQQIVWNLLTNAVKYTRSDGEIRASLRVAGAWIVLEVADDGQGISPDFLPRLFDAFQQAETPTNRTGGGLGLGMAIVKQLTELHGGEVEAESDGVGLGSRFTVRLPLSAAETSQASLRAKRDVRSPSLAGKRILVVEDDSDAREVLRRGLAAYGAEVLLASGTEEALRIVERMRPDVLVSDLAMPDRDGFDLIRELRARGFGVRDLPAVAVSALAGVEEEKRALTAGYQAHVPKPFDTEVLSAIASALAGAAGISEG